MKYQSLALLALVVAATSNPTIATPTGGSQSGIEEEGPTTEGSVASDLDIFIYVGSKKRFHGPMKYTDYSNPHASDCGKIITAQDLSVSLKQELMLSTVSTALNPIMCGRYINIMGPKGEARAQVNDILRDSHYPTYGIDGTFGVYDKVKGNMEGDITWQWDPQ